MAVSRKVKLFILSTVFLSAAFATGYLACASHAQRPHMSTSGGKAEMLSDKEYLTFMINLEQLGYSGLGPNIDATRRELEARRTKVTILSSCAIFSTVFGIALIVIGLLLNKNSRQCAKKVSGQVEKESIHSVS